MNKANFEKLKEKIKNIRIAMLTTIDQGGRRLQSRPMATQEIDNGAIWFYTALNSLKTTNVKKNPEVNLAYSDVSDETYVSISGTAEIINDRAKIKENWNLMVEAWFPNGADDPNVVMLKVTVKEAEYWDSPSNTMVQMYQVAKALITNTEPEMAKDHGVLV